MSQEIFQSVLRQNQLIISLKLPKGKQDINFKEESPVLCSKLNKKLLNILSQHKINTKYFIGFQTIEKDSSVDYNLQVQKGYIDRDVRLKCMWKDCDHFQNPIDKYVVYKCISIGGFSKVYLLRSKIDGTFFVGKFVEKSSSLIQKKFHLILNEQKINQELDHPFVAKMEEFIQTPEFFIFILEYCPGGEVFYLLRKIYRMTEEEVKPYFIQVLLAIQYLHSKGIIYRDLKPENILLDIDGFVKLADFGLAKKARERCFSFCGSLEYMSPQIIARSGYSFSADHYSLGCLLYELVVGCPPFYQSDSDSEQTKLRIMHEELTFPENLKLSIEIKALISGLLEKKESKRIGYFGGINEIKCHPWIGKINRQNYFSKEIALPFNTNLNECNFDADEISPSQERFTLKIRQEFKKNTKVTRDGERKTTFIVKKKSSHHRRQSSKEKISPYYQVVYKTSLQKTGGNSYSVIPNIAKRSSSQKKSINLDYISKSTNKQTKPIKKNKICLKRIKTQEKENQSTKKLMAKYLNIYTQNLRDSKQNNERAQAKPTKLKKKGVKEMSAVAFQRINR